MTQFSHIITKSKVYNLQDNLDYCTYHAVSQILQVNSLYMLPSIWTKWASHLSENTTRNQFRKHAKSKLTERYSSHVHACILHKYTVYRLSKLNVYMCECDHNKFVCPGFWSFYHIIDLWIWYETSNFSPPPFEQATVNIPLYHTHCLKIVILIQLHVCYCYVWASRKTTHAMLVHQFHPPHF